MVSDMMFRSFEAKRNYILKRRMLPKWRNKFINRRSICTECGLPYKPRINGSTVFLCSHCADLATKDPSVRESEKKKWSAYVAQYKHDEIASIECEVKKARDKVREDGLRDIFKE